MSTALLKKSLELVDTEFVNKRKVRKNKGKEKKVYSELKLKNKNKKHKDIRSIGDVKQGNLNSVQKIRKQFKKKNIGEGYKKKLKLLHKPPSRKLVDQILGYLGYGEDTKKKTEEEQKTAFTEEDFLKFEKESLQSIVSIRYKNRHKMRPNWLVVGLCGVTNSGKTSLAKALQVMYPGAHYICQDSYFRPVTWPGHVYVPEVDHFNWDVMSALDMETMVKNVHQLVDEEPEGSEQGILILDGFLLLCHEEISKICNIKVYIDLEYEEVKRRRETRSYDPPDPPGYFDKIVWPQSRQVREQIISTFGHELLQLNGKDPIDTNAVKISMKINALLKSSR